MSNVVAILGCGNMASALITGAWQQLSEIEKSQLEFLTYTPTQVRAQTLAQVVGGRAVSSMQELPVCDVYVIGCKPQQFDTLARDLRPLLKGHEIIISMMAALATDLITQALGGHSRVMRIMPNTPNLVGSGVNLFYSSVKIELPVREYWYSFFGRIGKSFIFENEELLDNATPYSGSGPGIIFEWARLWSSSLEQKGISAQAAREIIVGTLLGSAKMMQMQSQDLEILRNQVTSQGGVTAKALEVFSKYDLGEIIEEAMQNALTRGDEIRNGFKHNLKDEK